MASSSTGSDSVTPRGVDLATSTWALNYYRLVHGHTPTPIPFSRPTHFRMLIGAAFPPGDIMYEAAMVMPRDYLLPGQGSRNACPGKR